MRKQLTKTDLDFQMFSDYYKIYQDFYEPEDTDEYWLGLIRAIDEFYAKYDSKFARKIAIAYVDSREELCKLKNA